MFALQKNYALSGLPAFKVLPAAKASRLGDREVFPRRKTQLVEKGVCCFRIVPPSALRLWAGGFRLMVPLIHQMEDSTEGRINLNYSLFIFQYSLFISLQGQIPSVFAKQNSGRPVWPLRGDLGRSKTCRLPPAPPPAFEKAGPKLYFFYSLAPGVCRGIIICLPLLLFQLLQPLLPLTDPAGLDQRLGEHPQPAADPKSQ